MLLLLLQSTRLLFTLCQALSNSATSKTFVDCNLKKSAFKSFFFGKTCENGEQHVGGAILLHFLFSSSQGSSKKSLMVEQNFLYSQCSASPMTLVLPLSLKTQHFHQHEETSIFRSQCHVLSHRQLHPNHDSN